MSVVFKNLVVIQNTIKYERTVIATKIVPNKFNSLLYAYIDIYIKDIIHIVIFQFLLLNRRRICKTNQKKKTRNYKY